MAWDRFSYVLNNPLKFTDPSGNRECDDISPEGECINPSPGGYEDPDIPLSEEQIEEQLEEFGVVLDGDWSYEQMNAVLLAVIMVGEKLASRDNSLTPVDAFLEVFEDITFTWGLEGAGGGCKDITSGGCTSGSHLVNFMSMSGDLVNQTDRMLKNIIHELGHVFDNINDFGPRLDMPYEIYSNRDNILHPNNPINRYDWQQNQTKNSTETWADMFVAWTYDVWNPDPKNATTIDQAQKWMAEWLP